MLRNRWRNRRGNDLTDRIPPATEPSAAISRPPIPGAPLNAQLACIDGRWIGIADDRQYFVRNLLRSNNLSYWVEVTHWPWMAPGGAWATAGGGGETSDAIHCTRGNPRTHKSGVSNKAPTTIASAVKEITVA